MGNAKYAATRLRTSIGVAVLVVVATVVPVPSASASEPPPPDKTALIMGATSIPTWNDADVEIIMNQFIAPTHPHQTVEPVAVTTPGEMGPLTGLDRVLFSAFGPPSIWGPGGAGWPDEPWWKLSGLFDLTWDQSIQAGVADLETAMTKYGNDDLVIYGYSQGAAVASLEMRKLAEQYPAGTTAPDIDFVLGGDGNLPNGGFLARFPGLYIPILDISFNGPEPTGTQFDTVVIIRQYEAYDDFPLYPLNLLADVNALLGFFYVHLYPFDVSLADDTSAQAVSTDPTGKTSYYFFETKDLPLFGPLRSLGVPEPMIDVVEPFVRVLVELGYDRTIPLWEPTPARLIPTLDPAKVTADLVNAIGEGINNALALVGAAPLLSIPAAPVTDTGPATPNQQTIGTTQPTPNQQTIGTTQPTPNQGTIGTTQPTPNQQTIGTTQPTPNQGTIGTTQPTPNQQTIGTTQPTPNQQTIRTNQPTPSQQGSDTGQARSSKQRGGSANGDSSRGSANGDSSRGSANGNSSRGSANGNSSRGSANSDADKS